MERCGSRKLIPTALAPLRDLEAPARTPTAVVGSIEDLLQVQRDFVLALPQGHGNDWQQPGQDNGEHGFPLGRMARPAIG